MPLEKNSFSKVNFVIKPVSHCSWRNANITAFTCTIILVLLSLLVCSIPLKINRWLYFLQQEVPCIVHFYEGIKIMGSMEKIEDIYSNPAQSENLASFALLLLKHLRHLAWAVEEAILSTAHSNSRPRTDQRLPLPQHLLRCLKHFS